MKRADKIRLAAETTANEADQRDEHAREDARKEWGQVRRAAREAFLANGDWRGILNAFRDAEGFYTPTERAKMCTSYTDELVMQSVRPSR